MKKKDGSVDKIAIALMTIIIGGVLIFTNIAFVQAMETKSEITSLVRKHILDMESNGALTVTQKSAFKDKIEEFGAEDVSIDYGPALVLYGQEIYLEVVGKIPLTLYDYNEGKSKVLVPFKVRRSSIAKNYDN